MRKDIEALRRIVQVVLQPRPGDLSPCARGNVPGVQGGASWPGDGDLKDLPLVWRRTGALSHLPGVHCAVQERRGIGRVTTFHFRKFLS